MSELLTLAKDGWINISAGVYFIDGRQTRMRGTRFDISSVQRLGTRCSCFCFSPEWSKCLRLLLVLRSGASNFGSPKVTSIITQGKFLLYRVGLHVSHVRGFSELHIQIIHITCMLFVPPGLPVGIIWWYVNEKITSIEINLIGIPHIANTLPHE